MREKTTITITTKNTVTKTKMKKLYLIFILLVLVSSAPWSSVAFIAFSVYLARLHMKNTPCSKITSRRSESSHVDLVPLQSQLVVLQDSEFEVAVTTVVSHHHTLGLLPAPSYEYRLQLPAPSQSTVTVLLLQKPGDILLLPAPQSRGLNIYKGPLTFRRHGFTFASVENLLTSEPVNYDNYSEGDYK